MLPLPEKEEKKQTRELWKQKSRDKPVIFAWAFLSRWESRRRKEEGRGNAEFAVEN